MRVDTVPQLEVGAEVGEKQLLVGTLADGLHQLLVHRLLVSLSLVVRLPGLLLLLENVSLGLLGLHLLAHLEVLVVHVVGHLHTRDVNLGAGDDHELLVHATQWASVDGEWAVHQQETGGKLLQEDNTLATMTTSQHNENAARLDT